MTAPDWLEANAKLGNLYAQFEAGKLYLSGAGKINRVKGFGWLIVAEHNMKILGNCCASLQEEIEHTLEHAGSLLTSSEQKQAFDFAEQYLKGFDGCQERNGSGRANRQGI